MAENERFSNEYVMALQRRAELAEEMMETLRRLDSQKETCGHLSAFLYTADGGKTIICTLCKIAELEEKVRTLEVSLTETEDDRLLGAVGLKS